MPIPQLDALGFTTREDSKFFEENPVDPAIRKEFEGGFVSSRPRFTRTMMVFTTGFTDMLDADKVILMGPSGFYDLVRGGSGSFGYIHPVSGDVFTVRFKQPLKAKYVGMGGTHRWDVNPIELEIL
jgi:hypothetical protein